MQDKQSKEIVDSQGNTYKSTRDSKVKQFLKDNVWNILGTGLAAFITLVGTMNLVISKSFSVSCSSCYGRHRPLSNFAGQRGADGRNRCAARS